MNQELQQRISAIKAECEEILRLSEKATPGPWRSHLSWVTSGPRDVAKTLEASKEDDARFIAHAANVSPAMARVVLAAIDGLTAIVSLGPGTTDYQVAIQTFERIANQWEGKP